MKRTILSLITICCTSLALQAQMPQSYTLKSCLENGLQNNLQEQCNIGQRRLSADT